MTNLFQPPLVPGASYGNLAGQGNVAQTRNPYFTVAHQFLPRNLHDVIHWARYIALQSPVTTEVIRKLSTYPITSFTYSAEAPAVKSKYEEIIKSFRLRNALHDIGFQYHTVGNVFVSIYFPIHRSFRCKNSGCNETYNANKANFLVFKNYEFEGKCPKCDSRGIFTRIDTKSTDISQMNLIIWDPVNIAVNHNPISGKSEYYYTIPNAIKRKIMEGDRLFLNSTPWEFVQAVKDKQDFKFEDNHIFHLKNIDMGFSINGIAVPPLITHFNLVFYSATLRKANESISTDMMAPLRVVFPQAQTANSDPVVAISMRNFAANMEQAFVRHKQDNNHVLIAPVPIGYQAVSGEGKTLLVSAEIAQAEESLLLSMGVSRELLSGTTNWTSSTVGLRMLKNTLDSYITQIQEVMDWIFSKTSTYLGIEYCEVGLTPFQLTDDEALHAMLAALTQTPGKVSMTTLYEAMGRDYSDEMERVKEDAIAEAISAVKTQHEIEQATFLAANEINDMNKKDDTYKTALSQAHMLAEELLQTDPNTQRQVLQQLQLQDYGKWMLTCRVLLEAEQNLAANPEADGNVPGEGAPEGENQTPQGADEKDVKKKPEKKGGGPKGKESGDKADEGPPQELPEKPPAKPGVAPAKNPFHQQEEEKSKK